MKTGHALTISRIRRGTDLVRLPAQPLALLLILCFAALGMARAGTIPAEPLACNSTVSGTLETSDFVFGTDLDRFFSDEGEDNYPDSDQSLFDLYAFEVGAGESVSVDYSSSQFDTFLIVLEPDFSQEAFTSDEMVDFVAETAGTYYLVANGFDETELGDYQVALSCGLRVSGLWFDPALEGEGYNVIESSAGITIFFYGYSATGERLWLVTETRNVRATSGETLEFEVFVGTPGTFDSPSSSTTLQSWGTLRFTPDGCGAGIFALAGLDGSKQSNAQQLAAIAGAECGQETAAADPGQGPG